MQLLDSFSLFNVHTFTWGQEPGSNNSQSFFRKNNYIYLTVFFVLSFLLFISTFLLYDMISLIIWASCPGHLVLLFCQYLLNSIFKTGWCRNRGRGGDTEEEESVQEGQEKESQARGKDQPEEGKEKGRKGRRRKEEEK